LDHRGFRQAAELVGLLASYEIDRIVSSPAVRCVQTVEPLAQTRRIDVEPREGLSEERQEDDGVALVRSLQGGRVAVSCHGGLSEAVCGESQKKGEALVLGGSEVLARVRATGRS
jgi:8-oxo-dGTP diphosphatase